MNLFRFYLIDNECVVGFIFSWCLWLCFKNIGYVLKCICNYGYFSLNCVYLDII